MFIIIIDAGTQTEILVKASLKESCVELNSQHSGHCMGGQNLVKRLLTDQVGPAWSWVPAVHNWGGGGGGGGGGMGGGTACVYAHLSQQPFPIDCCLCVCESVTARNTISFFIFFF